MADNLLQNIDNPQDNPNMPETVKTEKKIPKDPKYIVLIVLVAIIVILSITALIVSTKRNNRPPIRTTPPTPTPDVEIVKTPTISTSQIPEEFQSRFDQIEKDINNQENLLPPQIDTEIGIK